MTALIIILALSFTWLLYETDWLRVRLPYGKTANQVFQSALATHCWNKPSDELNNALQSNTSTPYYWMSPEQKEAHLILCRQCRLTCKKDKERWLAWKISPRIVKAWGSTINFNEGCNIQRANLLRDIAKAQRR